ncbi:hypothetical protein ACGF0K_16070 [Streptomyces sp. NPDC048156]|uniref:hypothetical protein n=1 Tax=Streptomyces sp. NPDC048156 TaxID=3365502 RepID=UPI00371D67F4
MPVFYREFMDADITGLDSLADQLSTLHKDIKGLPQRVHGEVLVPLRNKGYWEGAAAPYAWRMIDDMQRQIDAADKVVEAMRGVVEDAVGEVKAVRRDLAAAVKRVTDKGMHVDRNGDVSPDIIDGICKPIEKDSEDERAIKAAQREIAHLCGRAVAADRNLAFSLMSDVGLGEWFNDKPQHTNIDTTDKIGEAEYNALGRAMQGKDPYPLTQGDSPYSLGGNWVTGEGSRDKEFAAGDKMTELIRSSESMKQLRLDTLHKWQTDGSDSGAVHYSISESGKLGAFEKLVTTDIPAIVTNDKDHLGEAFVGSYSLGYDVKGEDPDGSLVVEYTLDNSTSNASFLHYVGYYDWLEKTNRESGPFSSVDQKIVWTERIPAQSHKGSQ